MSKELYAKTEMFLAIIEVSLDEIKKESNIRWDNIYSDIDRTLAEFQSGDKSPQSVLDLHNRLLKILQQTELNEELFSAANKVFNSRFSESEQPTTVPVDAIQNRVEELSKKLEKLKPDKLSKT